MRTRDWTIRDYFGNAIEVGDRYYYGSPPTRGTVIKLRKTSILIERGGNTAGINLTMNCKSPDTGICVDRVPEGDEFWSAPYAHVDYGRRRARRMR